MSCEITQWPTRHGSATRRPLLQVLPSNDSERDPLRMWLVENLVFSHVKYGVWVFHPPCTILNDIVPSHSPVLQPSLWLSNDRLHMFFFCSLPSLAFILCLFERPILFLPPLESSLRPPWSNNPLGEWVARVATGESACWLFCADYSSLGEAVCYLWLRLVWLAKERYNYGWHSTQLVLELQ